MDYPTNVFRINSTGIGDVILKYRIVNVTVSLEQVSMNKPFRSARSSEQTLAARPEAMNNQYIRAAPPPALQKLNSIT